MPPKGWSPRAKDYEQRLVNLMVRHPIEQNVQGTGGFYEARNIVRDKMPLKQYRRYAEKEGARVAGLSSAQKQEMVWFCLVSSGKRSLIHRLYMVQI